MELFHNKSPVLLQQLDHSNVSDICSSDGNQSPRMHCAHTATAIRAALTHLWLLVFSGRGLARGHLLPDWLLVSADGTASRTSGFEDSYTLLEKSHDAGVQREEPSCWRPLGLVAQRP